MAENTGTNSLFPPPLRARIESLVFALSQSSARLGEGNAQQQGLRGSRTFAGHAPYAAGDDLRHVDWAAYGRLDKLYVRQFEREQERSVLIALDCTPSMLGGLSAPELAASPESGKFRAALTLCAALALMALRQKLMVSLRLGSAREHFTPESPKERLFAWISSAAERALADPPPVFFPDLAPALAPGSRALVISDLMEPLESGKALHGALARGVVLNLIGILTPEEWNPDLSGAKRLESREAEDAPLSLRITPALVAAYQRELAQHLEGWRSLLGSRGSRLHVLRTDAALEENARKLFQAGVLR